MLKEKKDSQNRNRKINQKIKEVQWFAKLAHLDYLNNDQEDIRVFTILEGQKRRLIVSIVLDTYLEINSQFDILIADFFFHHCQNDYELVTKATDSNEFKIFQSYILDEMPFLRKMAILKTCLTVPKEVIKNIEKINDLRNAMAHSHLPEKLRNDRAQYGGESIYSREAIKVFITDSNKTSKFLYKEFVNCFKKNKTN